MGSSCGQIASICAARLRTIDSSAISLACGLLGFMRASLTSLRRDRPWNRPGRSGTWEPVLALLAIVALLAAPAPGPDDVTVEAPGSGPGGTVYFGVGATFIAAQSPGGGLSYELAIELQRVLLLIDVLGGDGVHNYGTFLANAEIGGVLDTSEDWTPYLLGGVGYLAR